MNMLPCNSCDEDERIEANIPVFGQNSLKKFKKSHDGLLNPEPTLKTFKDLNYMSKVQIFSTPQDVKEFLPIKKRRLKNSASNNSRSNHDVIDDAVRQPASQSTAIYNYTDNSREWWLHANTSWSKNARRPSQQDLISLQKEQSQSHITQQNPPPSQEPQDRERSNIEILQKLNLDKDDPRSAEYQMWFDSYYPVSLVPSSSHKNRLLEKLKLVNPEAVGGKYPPWVSLEELQKWDISSVNCHSRLIPVTDRPNIEIDILNINPTRAHSSSVVSVSKVSKLSVQRSLQRKTIQQTVSDVL